MVVQHEAPSAITDAGTGQHRRGSARRSSRRPVGQAGPALKAASYVTVAVAALATLGPFFYILTTSLKDSASLFSYPPNWIPDELFWGNYSRLLTETLFVRWTVNTLIVATTVTALKLLFDSMAGYAFAKIDFPAKEPLFIFLLLGLMIPVSALLIPLFFLVRGMNLLNTYWALILPPLANPIGILLMRNFIQSLPRDLDNAARLDGCSEFAIYRRIVVPLVRPPLVVLGVLTFMIQYTSFIWPLVVTSDNRMNVLTTGLAGQRGVATIDWGAISAGGIMAMIPITIFFLALQRFFTAGSLMGALKQ
ncbi:MAG: carbohydrate ABC transporter permease [Euzebyaceae bacterium]|jgi:ABC-type glycerol-3-phosphate transport system permease component|nr:carbohydrate ABC transporter permease [Euzebyaceae bacterium]